ncbi:hypothetical protein [Rhizobium bangladeshense]|nr:hypothetical protein [Rhizobium bangladeshense]
MRPDHELSSLNLATGISAVRQMTETALGGTYWSAVGIWAL